MNKYDVIIIGGGAAGMTAALYSLRSGKSVLLLEKETIGGQISKSPRVENFPTIKEISGEELSSKLFDQIMDLGCEFELDTVTKLEKIDNTFKVFGEYGNYEALAGSTLSLPVNSADFHKLHLTCGLNLNLRGPILWRSSLVYEFENPDIDILGSFWDSKRNAVSMTMAGLSNFSSAVRFDARYNISYNNLRVDRNTDYNNAIIGHNLNCNTQVHLFGRCFFKADYAYTNRYNTRLRRTSQINCLNASLDVRVFSDRNGVISLNAYNVFDSRASITEAIEDLGIRSVYNPTNSTLFTISFKYKFGVEQ